MVKKSNKDSDSDDEAIGGGKDKRFDGSQEPLAVARMLASLERYYASKRLDAHKKKKWTSECTDADLADFVPPAVLPKMLPKYSSESDEEFAFRKADLLEKRRLVGFEIEAAKNKFIRQFQEKQEEKLAKALKKVLSLVKGSAADELQEVIRTSHDRNPLYNIHEYIQNNWLKASPEYADALETAYNEFKCQGDPLKAMSNLLLKKKQYEISNKKKVPNVDFLRKLLNFVPSTQPKYYEESKRIKEVLDTFIAYGYDFDEMDNVDYYGSDVEDDESSIGEASTVILAKTRLREYMDDDPSEIFIKVELSVPTAGGSTVATDGDRSEDEAVAVPKVEGDSKKVDPILEQLSRRLDRLEVENANLIRQNSRLISASTDKEKSIKDFYIKENRHKLTVRYIMTKFKGIYDRVG
jgi:hypothetical protein